MKNPTKLISLLKIKSQNYKEKFFLSNNSREIRFCVLKIGIMKSISLKLKYFSLLKNKWFLIPHLKSVSSGLKDRYKKLKSLKILVLNERNSTIINKSNIIRDKGFNRPKMTYYWLKNGLTKYFDDRIDRILFLSKKVLLFSFDWLVRII